MKTKVKFLINEKAEEEPDVFAYFPEEDFSEHNIPGYMLKTCYSHIGQHSACHPDYAAASRYATEPEYRDLKEELESIGYELEII